AVTVIAYAGMCAAAPPAAPRPGPPPGAPGPPGPPGPPARGAAGAPGVGGGAVRTLAIVATSSTFAMNRAGAFSRPALYDQWSCQRSSMPTVAWRFANT